MRCNWRRWLWGVIPLVALALAAVQLERAAIEQDLTERAQRALAAKGAHWAVVNFSGRDVVLTGNAIADNEPGEAVAVLRDLWGVAQRQERCRPAASWSSLTSGPPIAAATASVSRATTPIARCGRPSSA